MLILFVTFSSIKSIRLYTFAQDRIHQKSSCNKGYFLCLTFYCSTHKNHLNSYHFVLFFDRSNSSAHSLPKRISIRVSIYHWYCNSWLHNNYRVFLMSFYRINHRLSSQEPRKGDNSVSLGFIPV